MNEQFASYLSHYSIKPHLMLAVLSHLYYAVDQYVENATEIEEHCRANLASLDKRIEKLEDDFYLDKTIPADVYERLRTKLATERKEVLEKMAGNQCRQF